MKPEQLVGTWRLENWETRYDTGRVIHPMGEDAQGLLVYAPDGYMSVVLFRNGRAPFTTGEMLSADADEKIAGWDSYYSYCGPFELKGDCVIHHIEACLYPNWIGTTQERQAVIDGGNLILKTDPPKTRRGVQTSAVTWSRAVQS